MDSEAGATSECRTVILTERAEAYILYLNATAETETKERGEARKFLLDNFNITVGDHQHHLRSVSGDGTTA